MRKSQDNPAVPEPAADIYGTFHLVSSCQVKLHLYGWCQIGFDLFLIQFCWLTLTYHPFREVVGHSFLSAARCICLWWTLEIPGQGLTGGVWWQPPSLLLGISAVAAIRFVFIHRSFLLILSDRSGFFFFLFFRQFLISVWILLPLVIFHVSAPHSSTDSFLFFIAFISPEHSVAILVRHLGPSLFVSATFFLLCFFPYFNRNLPQNHSWAEWFPSVSV